MSISFGVSQSVTQSVSLSVLHATELEALPEGSLEESIALSGGVWTSDMGDMVWRYGRYGRG